MGQSGRRHRRLLGGLSHLARLPPVGAEGHAHSSGWSSGQKGRCATPRCMWVASASSWEGRRTRTAPSSTTALSSRRCTPVVAVHGKSPEAVRPLPVFALLVLEHLAEQWQRRGLYPCAEACRAWAYAPRVDAMASEDRVGIGGWRLACGASGAVEKGRSHWFATAVTPQDLPWAFQRQGEAYRLICSLELLGGASRLHAPWANEGGGS